ncbi:MAG: DUF433 domain-containing protein [Syntrophales bacterium]
MASMNRIGLNPRVCNGRPAIRSSRIPVSVILEQIAEGDSCDTVLSNYPELEKEVIRVALICARESMDHTEIRVAYA